MKKINLFVLALMVMLTTTIFHSCDKNDGYSIGDIGASWATVRIISGDTYYLDSDNFGTLWLAADAARWYKPVDGERVISYFNPLHDNYNGYNMAIKLEAIYPILTKQVEELTLENSAEFGNDPIVISKGNIWVSNGYMNIIFRQNIPMTEKHMISLVQGASINGNNSEYAYLELRYNTFDDTTGYWQDGAVSFNLNSVDFTNKKGIILKLNSETNGEVEVQLNFVQTEEEKASFNRVVMQEDKLK